MPISLWRGSHKRSAREIELLWSYSFACIWLGQENDSAPAAVAQRSSWNSRTNHQDIFLHLQCTFYQKKESILSTKASIIFFSTTEFFVFQQSFLLNTGFKYINCCRKCTDICGCHLPVMWKLWQRSARQQFVLLGRWVWRSRRWWTGNIINRLIEYDDFSSIEPSDFNIIIKHHAVWDTVHTERLPQF